MPGARPARRVERPLTRRRKAENPQRVVLDRAGVMVAHVPSTVPVGFGTGAFGLSPFGS